MAKTTDLNVEVVVGARLNYSPIPLVEAWGFEPAIAIAYGYDESRSLGPCGETRQRARERPCRAMARSQIAAVSDQIDVTR